jgi:O-antigen/teichoic acid export membrane protein
MSSKHRVLTDNSRIIKNSGILYIRLFITSIITLFTSRIVLQSLGASDYGLYSVVGGIVVLMGFLNTVMVSTSYRFIAFEIGKGNSEGVNKVFNISLLIHIFLAFVVVLLAETLGSYYIHNYLNISYNRIEDAMFVFRFSVLATVFSIISIPYQALITAHEKFSILAFIDILLNFLKLGAVIILIYYLGNRLRLYSVLMAVISLVPPILFILFCRKVYASIIRWNFQRDKNKYKEMIGFSGWIMLGAGASVGKVQGAALIINSFFGTILNASFGIASQVNNVILMFSQNLGQAAIPQITKSFSSGNSDRTMQLVCYVSKYSFFLMLFPALPILLETDFILKLWLVKVPEYTTVFCQLMIINALIDCLSSGIPAAIQATGKIKYFQIILSTISLLSLPVAFILFRFGYPPFVIIVTYIIAALLNTVIQQILLKKLIRFDVKGFLKKSYLKILYVILCVSPLFLIRNLFQDSITRFILISSLSVMWFLFMVYLVGIENKEKELLLSELKKVYVKFQKRSK